MDSLSLKKITHYHNTSDRINMVSAIQLLLIVNGASYVTFIRDRRGRDRMVVGLTTTCAIRAYHQ